MGGGKTSPGHQPHKFPTDSTAAAAAVQTVARFK